jgi:hypothetical protein
MKDAEDEAQNCPFDDLARRQGAWGGGYRAKRAAAADKLQEPIYNITVFDNAHPKGIPYEDWVQPAQEPVACVQDLDEVKRKHLVYEKGMDWKDPLYTAPPKRPWAGLTDDELADLWYKESLDWMEFARAHEAALKEKNNG